MIEIIPAIDIINGKCVRLTQGDYNTSKEYNANPVEVAKELADAGCRRLHVVDLEGAKDKHIVNYKTLNAIAGHTSLIIDFGGGVKSDEDVKIAFECGAHCITGGSVAVDDPHLFKHWLELYGSERIILGADSKDVKIATRGWTNVSNEETTSFIARYVQQGIRQVICTDINKDGMLGGSSTQLYSNILDLKLEGLYLIASGGIGNMADVLTLNELGVPAVIVGKALYEGRISLKQLQTFNSKQC